MSPKTLIIAGAVATASALTALPAVAAQGEPQNRELPVRAQVMFNLVDVNGDGFVDQTEIAALQRAIFASIDADGDGKLSEAEFRKLNIGPRGARHGHLQGHGPRGQMGPGGEHRGPRGERHGQVEPGNAEQAPGQGPGGRMQRPQLGEGEFQGPFGPGRDFAALDTDGDGLISIEEFAAGRPAQPAVPQ